MSSAGGRDVSTALRESGVADISDCALAPLLDTSMEFLRERLKATLAIVEPPVVYNHIMQILAKAIEIIAIPRDKGDDAHLLLDVLCQSCPRT